MIKKYRHLPTEVEAIQFKGRENAIECMKFIGIKIRESATEEDISDYLAIVEAGGLPIKTGEDKYTRIPKLSYILKDKKGISLKSEQEFEKEYK